MAWSLESIGHALEVDHQLQAQNYFQGLVWKKLQAEIYDIMSDECIPNAWAAVRNVPNVVLWAPPLAAQIAALAQASAHVLYSMGDTLAQCANLVCRLGIDEQDVYLTKICRIVRQRNALRGISKAMDELENGDWFRYLGGFVNITKHRTIIPFSRGMSQDHTEMEVRFGAFTYMSKRDGTTREYGPRLAANLLKDGRQEVVGLVGSVWDALEQHLGAHT